MITKEEIKKIVFDAIYSVTGVMLTDEDISLLDNALGIFPAFFIYIFNIIEEKTNVTVDDIFENRTYEVMTVNNLTEAIFSIMTC